ncbi:MAG: nucleoside-diphosphate sugar epimerase/dehydratase [Bacilli bacterium]|nr:nucleoside-diphosphate sugar epimerase/dehydratase [Bacilli bacterium]
MNNDFLKKLNHRHFRTTQFILVDCTIIFIAYWFGLYHIQQVNLFDVDYWLYIILGIIGIKIIFLIIFNLYNLLLEFVGIMELLKLVASELVSSILIYIIFAFAKPGLFSLDFMILVMPVTFILHYFLRGAKRLFLRLRIIVGTGEVNGLKIIPTLVIGAGSGGKMVLDEVTKNLNLHNRIVAFVDDSPEKIHKSLNGIPIYGPVKDSVALIERFKIQEVIIAIANIESIQLKELIRIFNVASIKIKRLPLMTEISGDSAPTIIDVKIEDLLARGVVDLQNEGVSEFLHDKVVLVTGGGGSIGSELCNQIISYNPRTLIIFDIYENTTYDVQLDLRQRIQEEQRNIHLVVLIGSVYNDHRIEEVMKKYHPQIIFHAAAYKHVPLMEDSAVEAVRTNVLGTYNVASLANKYHAEKMVLVSTDKAVRPTNVMGATKSCCEKIIQYFDNISETNYSAVRFGNVLGSHGSVVPLFKKQITQGGPITITHRDITRYFMTIPEAVSLILQSGVYATGGEIFILDMGEPVRIYNMAEQMIRLSGLVPHVDIQIKEIGLRPGEKLYEELLVDVENNIKTKNDKIFIEHNHQPIKNIEDFVATIRSQFEVVSNQEVKSLVQSLVTEYIIDDKTSN